MKIRESKALERIYGFGRGHCFTPKRFLDLGSRGAIDMVLSSLAEKGTILRGDRGIYDYPCKDKDFALGLLTLTPQHALSSPPEVPETNPLKSTPSISSPSTAPEFSAISHKHGGQKALTRIADHLAR